MEEHKQDSPAVVAEMVKRFLRRRGTIKEAAATLGVSFTTLSTQLSDAKGSYLSQRIAGRLSRAFGLNVEYLTTGFGNLIKEERGGWRPGAGRPQADKEKLRKNVTMRLAPETVQLFQYIQNKGISVSRIVDSLIQSYCRLPGIDIISNENNENLTFE